MSTVGTRWYTIAEAAPLLGVSVDTVRRRVKRGQLESRQVRTQHGPTWEVCLGTLQGEPAPAAEGTEGAAQAAEDRSQAMAVWAATLLAPLAAELGEARQTIERQAETIGRQGAELDQARGTLGELQARYDQALAWGRRLVAAVVVLVALGISALTLVLAPAWVR